MTIRLIATRNLVICHSKPDHFVHCVKGLEMTRICHSPSSPERNHSKVSGQNRIARTTAQMIPQTAQVMLG